MKKVARFLPALLVAVVFAAMSTPANAAAGVVLSAPAASAAGFATPVVVTTKAAGLTQANLDNVDHNVQAVEIGPNTNPWCAGRFASGKCPVFWSPLIGLGETSPVQGIDKLTTGKQYAFVCVLHGAMKGTLVVAA